MDRITNIDQSRVDYWRNDYATTQTHYTSYSTPCPGTALKLDDDVLWIDIFPARVIWGTDDPYTFFAYCNDFGDLAAPLDVRGVTDRAPKDPEEPAMPVMPQQQRQRQPEAFDPKRALHELLKKLDHEGQKRVRALVKAKRPELLEGSHK